MPTTLTSTSFTVNFNITSTTKTLVLTDTSDYAGNGVALADVTGFISVTDPNGNNFYNNTSLTPDINGALPGGLVSQLPINLPLLPNGSIVPGVYTVVLTTYIVGNTPPSIVSSNTYNYTFVAPTVSITQTVNCITPSFTSADTTNYVVNGVAPTTINRTHVVYFPTVSPSSTTGTGATVVLGSGQFYQGLQQTVLTSTVTYNFGSGQTVTVTITGTKSIAVDCTYFCAIYCCLRSINSNIKKYKGVNDMLASQYESIFVQVMGLIELATLAYSCGKQNDVSGYVAQIQALADCTDDCSCQDGAPNPVFGLGGAGSGVNVTVASCGNGSIAVTQSGTAPNITYTVCLDPTLLSKINNSYNTAVVAGTGIGVSSSTSGNLVTYTVSNTFSEPNLLSFKLNIAYTAIVPLLNITLLETQIDGSLFQPPSTYTSLNFGSPSWLKRNNYFQFDDFLDTAVLTRKYKVFATLEPRSVRGVSADNFYTRAQYYDVEILNTQIGTGQVYFRLVNTRGVNAGSPVTNQQLVNESYNADIHFLLTTY